MSPLTAPYPTIKITKTNNNGSNIRIADSIPFSIPKPTTIPEPSKKIENQKVISQKLEIS